MRLPFLGLYFFHTSQPLVDPVQAKVTFLGCPLSQKIRAIYSIFMYSGLRKPRACPGFAISEYFYSKLWVAQPKWAYPWLVTRESQDMLPWKGKNFMAFFPGTFLGPSRYAEDKIYRRCYQILGAAHSTGGWWMVSGALCFIYTWLPNWLTSIVRVHQSSSMNSY